MNNPVQAIKNLLKIPNQIESLFINNFKIDDSISIIQGTKLSGKTSLVIEMVRFLTLKGKNILYVSAHNNQLKLLEKIPEESMTNLVYVLTQELEDVFQYIDTALEQKKVDYIFIDDFSNYSRSSKLSESEQLKKYLYKSNSLCKKENIGLCFISAHGDLEWAGWSSIGPNLPLSLIASTIIEVEKIENESDTYIMKIVKKRYKPMTFKENGLNSVKFNMKEESNKI